MWSMILPLLIVVVSNTFYHISAKSTPENINTFASLSVTYGIGTVCSLVMFFITTKGGNFVSELGKINWTTIVLGIAVVGLECGFLLGYRSGWKISLLQLISSVSLAVILIIVGLIFYKEQISVKQIIGIVVCVAGLILITN